MVLAFQGIPKDAGEPRQAISTSHIYSSENSVQILKKIQLSESNHFSSNLQLIIKHPVE